MDGSDSPAKGSVAWLRHLGVVLHKRGNDLLPLDKAYDSSKMADRRANSMVSVIYLQPDTSSCLVWGFGWDHAVC
jgi:hypothetical protein